MFFFAFFYFFLKFETLRCVPFEVMRHTPANERARKEIKCSHAS